MTAQTAQFGLNAVGKGQALDYARGQHVSIAFDVEGFDHKDDHHSEFVDGGSRLVAGVAALASVDPGFSAPPIRDRQVRPFAQAGRALEHFLQGLCIRKFTQKQCVIRLARTQTGLRVSLHRSRKIGGRNGLYLNIRLRQVGAQCSIAFGFANDPTCGARGHVGEMSRHAGRPGLISILQVVRCFRQGESPNWSHGSNMPANVCPAGPAGNQPYTMAHHIEIKLPRVGLDIADGDAAGVQTVLPPAVRSARHWPPYCAKRALGPVQRATSREDEGLAHQTAFHPPL